MKRLNGLYLKLFVILAAIVLTIDTNVWADNKDDCVECFSTEIISIEQGDDCLTISLEIHADETCRFALSHFVVAIPCGTVSEAWNSGGWKMEYIITDPTTGVRGLKVDDIQGFGENGQTESFTLTYKVCGDSDCLATILNGFEVSYKAAWCVYYEDVIPEIIDETEELSADISVTHVSCYGLSDGSLFLSVEGGETPYAYNWSNGAETAELQNITADHYSVTITDAAGNEIELSAEVQQPENINITATSEPATCAEADGYIELEVTGGTGDYQYLWSNGAETAYIYNLTSGVYQIKVTDESGCSATRSYYIDNQSPIQITGITNRPKCHETNTGTIDLTVSGGTEPYTYQWSTGATTQNLSQLNTGSYRVTVTDAEGCVQTRSFTIMNEIFYASTNITHADCQGDGGSVILTPNNGTAPYVAEWSTGDTGLEVDNLPVGQHSVLITDANGCQILQQVNILSEDAVNLNVSISSETCNSDPEWLVQLSASGGQEPYQFYLDGEAVESQFLLNEAGEYLISVTDQNGCSDNENISVILPEHSLQVNTNVVQPDCFNPDYGTVTVQISGGVEPYTILWNGVENPDLERNLNPGLYEISVVDAMGCEALTSVEIKEITIADVTIELPDTPICESTGNEVYAEVNNVDEYFWVIDSEMNDWVIISQSTSSMHFDAGIGNATISLMVTSPDGCEAIDLIELSCTEGNGDGDNNPSDPGDDDNANPGDGDSGDENTEEPIDQPETDCMSGCITLEELVVIDSYDDCKRYELTFVTDGSCRYELSHLVIDLDGHTAYNVSNSRNWKLEINSTDPKSGLTGIKVDDISNFGKTAGDSFTVSFELCDAEDFDTSSLLVAFKAGRCLEITELDTGSLSLNEEQIEISVYPNPSKEDTWIQFVSNEDTKGTLTVYSQTGIPVEVLFNGKIQKGVTYRVKHAGHKSNDTILFYQLVTGFNKQEGKILRIK